ncbi:flocculation protein FLO11, partial [Biomphalaria glabrata]
RMVRNYQRKTQRASYGAQNLTEALTALNDGVSLKTTSKKFNIPPKTLRRHRDSKVQKPGSIILGRFRRDFSEAEELDLVDIITKMEQSVFRLSPLDIRKLAYEFATNLGIKHRFNTKTKIAGKDWLCGFLKRHQQQLSVCKPEAFTNLKHVGFDRSQLQENCKQHLRNKNLIMSHNEQDLKITMKSESEDINKTSMTHSTEKQSHKLSADKKQDFATHLKSGIKMEMEDIDETASTLSTEKKHKSSTDIKQDFTHQFKSDIKIEKQEINENVLLSLLLDKQTLRILTDEKPDFTLELKNEIKIEKEEIDETNVFKQKSNNNVNDHSYEEIFKPGIRNIFS